MLPFFICNFLNATLLHMTKMKIYFATLLHLNLIIMNLFKKFYFMLLLSSVVMLATSCDDDDDVPPEENEEEIITDVTLTFTPSGGGAPVTATAADPDGEGPQSLQIVSNIALAANTTYTLTLDLQNAIEGESITEEVEEEDEEHMFFFGWTGNVFSNPSGDGNIDNRADVVNYNDQDSNGNPLGLSTTWTTAASGNGTFRVVLKHQPDLKTATSTAQDGSSDVDLTFNIQIQ